MREKQSAARARLDHSGCVRRSYCDGGPAELQHPPRHRDQGPGHLRQSAGKRASQADTNELTSHGLSMHVKMRSVFHSTSGAGAHGRQAMGRCKRCPPPKRNLLTLNPPRLEDMPKGTMGKPYPPTKRKLHNVNRPVLGHATICMFHKLGIRRLGNTIPERWQGKVPRSMGNAAARRPYAPRNAFRAACGQRK